MTSAHTLKPCAGRCGYLVDLARPHRVLNEHLEQLRDGEIDVLASQDTAHMHLRCTPSRWRNRLANAADSYRYYAMEATYVASIAASWA
jgi:hypothetical protein